MKQRSHKRVLTATALFAFAAAAFLFSLLPTPYPPLPNPEAQALEVGLNEVGAQIELGGDDIRIVIARIIRVALGLLGVAALLIVLWGGFQWMTAGGEEDKIASAKKTLINGTIGLAIVLSAFAITQFILNALIAATTGITPGGVPGPSPFISQSGSLGRGVVDMHYPPRGATGVPRNTNLIITFKQAMQLQSVIAGYDDAGTPANLSDDPEPRGARLNTNTVQIYRTAQGPDGRLAADQVVVRATPDRKTFVFDPVELLGSASENMLYTVELPGDGLRLENGNLAFTGAFSDGYAWQFETSTLVDLTPPVVTDCFPACPVTPGVVLPPPLARNVLIQVNFNEAVDPTSVTLPGNVTVNSGGLTVGGSWQIGNEYRTIEFVTDAACGTNSCDETIFCLPGNAEIAVAVRAHDPPDASFPWTGLVDAAGNSLNDRQNNATAEGSPEDDVNFSFSTSGEIDLIGPRIESVEPTIFGENVASDVPVRLSFNEVMSRASINTGSVTLTPAPEHELWYSLSSENRTAAGAALGPDDTPARTRAEVRHALLYRTPIGEPSQNYAVGVRSSLRDAFQNCYVPGEGPGEAPGTSCPVTPEAPYCCDGSATANPTCHGVDLSARL